ncbi:MAG: hypothetical protein V2A73_15995 [Pseudomonadota bacterium]
MTRVLWPWAACNHWDQAMLRDLFAGRLWPMAEPFVDEMEPTRGGEGAVVVCSGALLAERGDQELRALLGVLPWAIFVHTSDEVMLFDSSKLAREARVKVWCQTPRFDRNYSDRKLLIGWPPATRDIVERLPRLPLADRPLLWAFQGQSNHVHRQRMVDVLGKRNDGRLVVTGGFAQGKPRPEYLADLGQARIVPCPSGLWTPDSFRMAEALEAGCLPCVERRSPQWKGGGNFWQFALNTQPMPCVKDWTELPRILDGYRSNPVALQRDANRAAAWWLGYKRQLACNLLDDVETLSGKPPEPLHQVTVLMPTSSIPSHPSTAFIEDAITRLRAYPEMANAEVIIMVDGLHASHRFRSADYEEYKRRLIDLCSWDPRFRGCLPLVFDEHTHQANMTRLALELVRTPLVFFQEHDTWPCWDIDWVGLKRAFWVGRGVNMITLHIDHQVLDEHKYLTLGDVEDINGVPLLRHCKWSQRPHMASTSWYRGILAEFFGRNARTMIEDVMWGIVSTRVQADKAAWGRFGLWMYHPDDSVHGVLRSQTRDGRAGEAKVPLVIAYDGMPPECAPVPGVKRW